MANFCTNDVRYFRSYSKLPPVMPMSFPLRSESCAVQFHHVLSECLNMFLLTAIDLVFDIFLGHFR